MFPGRLCCTLLMRAKSAKELSRATFAPSFFWQNCTLHFLCTCTCTAVVIYVRTCTCTFVKNIHVVTCKCPCTCTCKLCNDALTQFNIKLKLKVFSKCFHIENFGGGREIPVWGIGEILAPPFCINYNRHVLWGGRGEEIDYFPRGPAPAPPQN